MRRVVLFFLLIAVSPICFAADGAPVTYVSGSAAGVKIGSTGNLDATAPDVLVFQTLDSKLAIPYEGIASVDSPTKLAHPMGVLPTVAVGLIVPLHHRHYIRISYRDAQQVPQVALFEVPKQLPMTLMPLIYARSHIACQPMRPCQRR